MCLFKNSRELQFRTCKLWQAIGKSQRTEKRDLLLFGQGGSWEGLFWLFSGWAWWFLIGWDVAGQVERLPSSSWVYKVSFSDWECKVFFSQGGSALVFPIQGFPTPFTTGNVIYHGSGTLPVKFSLTTPQEKKFGFFMQLWNLVKAMQWSQQGNVIGPGTGIVTIFLIIS